MRAVGRWVAGLAFVALACSSSSPQGPGEAPVPDASIDAPIGPIVCGVPMASTCPSSPPCTFSGWSCPVVACDGYFVVTDGTWNYFYSSSGQELAGVTAVGDAGVQACPYGFEPPSCPATPASPCASDAGPG